MATPREILERATTIAVVGLSRDPRKAAHSVPAAMQRAGFEIIPVNPYADELLGRRAYARLTDVTEHVDVVDVFRPSADAAEIARQAVEIEAGSVWLQLGIRSDEARRIVEEAGIDYVEDRCIAVERSRAGITKGAGG